MSIDRFFSTGITYKVATVARSQAGGELVTYDGDAVTLSGRIRPMNGNELLASAKMNIASTHILYCHPEANLNVKSKVYLAGKEYNVKYIKDPMTYAVYWAVSLEIIE